MPRVNSSAISHVDYNDAKQEMYITFIKSHKTYTYFGVPRDIYEAFLAASSKGRFFDHHIKDQYSARSGWI